MSFGDTLEALLLDHVFISDQTAPDPIYVGVSGADPGEDGSTNNEPSGGAYARVSVARGAANWTRSGNSVTNDNDIDFPQATADWLTGSNLTHGSLWNSAAGTASADFLGSGSLTTARAVLNGDTFSIPAGNLTVTLD